MNKIIVTTKFLLYDFIKALVIYYGIILAVCGLMVYLYFQFAQSSNGEVRLGFGNASLIFIFVSGLNSFKKSFKFMQANNISRKRFFAASIITFFCVSAIMTALDILINTILSLIIPNKSVFEQVYGNSALLPEFVFSTAFMAFAAAAGFFITMLYYKCSNLMKVIISFSPVILLIIYWRLDTAFGGSMSRSLLAFAAPAFGIEPLNPYMAVLSFAVMFVAAAALCYLLLRRMTIKD